MGNFYPVLPDCNVGYLRNVRRVVGKVEKDPRVLLSEGYFSNPSVPWEQRIDNGYPNVFYDGTYGEYRCYYTCFIRDEASTELPPKERVDKEYRFYDRGKYAPRVAGILLITSKDGVHWERPSLGVCQWEGSTDNNIVLTHVHGASVFKDDREPDPAKRYKMVVRHDAHDKMAVSFSPDGIHWCKPIDWPQYNPAGDTHNFAFWDERIGRYVLITRTWAQGTIRLAARCESDDFIHWTEPVEIYRGNGFDDQIYSMPVFQRGGVYYGLGSIFHGGDRAGEDFDCVDCELLYSLDGWHWERAALGQPLIPRSPGRYGDDVPDCGCIYASAPVECDGKYVIYYFGSNGQHTNFREASLMRAFIDPDRLAGYTPKSAEGGYLGSCWVKVTGDELYIVADLLGDRGSIEAAVCWPTSLHGPLQELEGYGFADSLISRHSNGHLRVQFGTRRLSDLPDERLMLVFRLRDAVLYGYGGDIEAIRREIG
ncbi:MAG TPA: hypothetical protein GXX47_00860 [Firmicutes bacterium]|nr:hypothetical protein [Bacillota bacterium]